MRKIRTLILLFAVLIVLGCSEEIKVKYEMEKYIDSDYVAIVKDGKGNTKVQKSDVIVLINQPISVNHLIIGQLYTYMSMKKKWETYTNKGNAWEAKWVIKETKESYYYPFLPHSGYQESSETVNGEYIFKKDEKSKEYPLVIDSIELLLIFLSDAIDMAKDEAVKNNCDIVYLLDSKPSYYYSFLLGTTKRTPVNKPKPVKK